MDRRRFFGIGGALAGLAGAGAGIGTFAALYNGITKKLEVNPTLNCGFEQRGDKTFLVMTSLGADGRPKIEGYGTFKDKPEVRPDGTVAYNFESLSADTGKFHPAGRIVYDEKAGKCKRPGPDGEIVVSFNNQESKRRLALIAEIETLGPYPDAKKLQALLGGPSREAGLRPTPKP